MIQLQKYGSDNDLGSANFESEVSNLSGRNLTQIREKDEIFDFFQVLLIENEAISVNIVRPDGQVFKNLLSIHGENLKLKDSEFLNSSLCDNVSTIYFKWLNTTYCFFFSAIQNNDSGYYIDIPDKIYIIHRRKWDRLPCEQQHWSIRLQDGSGNSTDSLLLNVGHRGFAFKTHDKAINFQLFQNISIFLSENREIKIEILHINQKKDFLIIGCRILDESLGAYRQYLTEIASIFYPDVIKVELENDKKDLIKVFQNSLMRGIFPASSFLTRSKESEPVGAYFLLKDGERPCAALATHQIYPKTWLLHTLGLSKEFAMGLPNNLFHRISYYLNGEHDALYFCGFWPSQSKLFDRSYTAFAKKDFHPSDHHLEIIDILQFKTNDDSNGELSKEIQCDFVGANDLLKVKELIQANCSSVYQDALDLDKNFGIKPVSDAGRKRLILVAKVNEKILGISILECAQITPLTFGLSNNFRLFFEQDVDRTKIGSVLFAKSLSVFRSENIGICNLYLPNNHGIDISTFGEPAARLENIYYWIVRNTRVKAFIRHLEKLNWELRFLEKNKSKIKPSLLRKIRFSTEAFKRRRCSRLEDLEQLKVVRCEIGFDDGRSVPVSLTSLDTYGFSIEIPSSIHIKSGDQLKFKLKIPNESLVDITSEVQFVVDRPAPGFSNLRRYSGFKFMNGSANSLKILREFTFKKLNSELNIYETPDFKPLTDLFESSKYFDYYEGVDHQKFIEEGRPTYSNLDHLYPDLIRTTVLKDQSKVLGTHSFYRLTPKTWQLHQLVVDEKLGLYKAKIPTKVVLQGSFQYLTLDPSVDYFVTYFGDQAAIAKTYFEVRNHHDNPQDYAFVSYRGFVFENVENSTFITSGKFEINEAEEEEIHLIQGYLATLVSKLEFEALDFDNLKQSEFLLSWKQRGFQRDRKVFVVKNKKGDILHFAIANLSPHGANLISLLDIFRVFDLPWCGETPDAARFDLVNFVVAYFQKQGRTQVYLEVDEGVGNLYSALPARDLGKNWRLIASRPSFMTALSFFISRFEKLEKRLVKHTKFS